MRVTSTSMLLQTVRNLRTGQAAVQRAQAEAMTGRRVRTLSDDPLDAGQILRLEGEVRDLDQFARNGSSANVRLATEDAVLTSLRGVLARARTAAIGATMDDPAAPERQNALQEVRHLIEQAISLGNTRVGGEYIFAGVNTGTPAFAADGTYQGFGLPRTVQVDRGVNVTVNHTGDQVLSSAITALNALADRLALGTADDIRALQTSLDTVANGVLGAQAEVGSRQLQVKLAGQDLAQRSVTLLDLRDALRQADPAESAVRLNAAQSALERAYAVVGKVFSTSLIDHLR